MYKTRQPLFTGSNGQVCAQHGCEYDVVGTARTSTEMGDELHRSEKKRGKHGAFDQQKAWCGCWACWARNIMTRLVEVWQHISGLYAIYADCVGFAFPINGVSFGATAQDFPRTNPRCVQGMLFVVVRHHHVRTREQTFVDIHFSVSWETGGHILIRCHSVLMSLQCGLGISLPFVGRRIKLVGKSRAYHPIR